MDGHVIAYRLHEAMMLISKVDIGKLRLPVEGPMVGRMKA